MTARKRQEDWRPKGAGLSHADDQWFEAWAIVMIENNPTPTWETAIALWRGLPSAWPATRDRILRRMFKVAGGRGDGWSPKLVKRFAEIAHVVFADTEARDRVHQAEALQKAARYKARHPEASWNDIAEVVGAEKEALRKWTKRSDFKKYKEDEEHLIETELKTWQSLPRQSDGPCSDEGFSIDGEPADFDATTRK